MGASPVDGGRPAGEEKIGATYFFVTNHLPHPFRVCPFNHLDIRYEPTILYLTTSLRDRDYTHSKSILVTSRFDDTLLITTARPEGENQRSLCGKREKKSFGQETLRNLPTRRIANKTHDTMAQPQPVYAPGQDDRRPFQHSHVPAEHAALVQSRETGDVLPDDSPAQAQGDVKALPFAKSWVHMFAGG